MPVLVLPADAASLADAAMIAVRQGVATGELQPSETYSIYQLATLLGISRTPVREAITRLAGMGLVEISRNRGFRVLLPRARDIEEIIEIRLALEPRAARRAAIEGDEEQHAAIRSALDAMATAAASGEEPAFWSADLTLHRNLMLAAGNTRAAAIVEQLREVTALLGPPTTASGRTLRAIHAEHRPIVDAVLARDGTVAQSTMRRHLQETGRLLLTGLD